MSKEGTYQAVFVKPNGMLHREFINGANKKEAKKKVKELFPNFELAEFHTRVMSEGEANTAQAAKEAKEKAAAKKAADQQKERNEKRKARKKK